MSGTNSHTLRIADLADRLLEDITTRDLQPGDPYMSTSEASKFLGVGSSSANRALQLLDKRRIITRQQRRGAFIVKRPGDVTEAPLRSVHFLVHQKYFNSEGVGNDHILIGMQQELPGVHVQISFLPTAQETSFVADLIHATLKGDRVDGFVLVRVGYEVQRMVSASGLPAVVYGSVFPGVGEIARFDRDMFAVGEVLTTYLLDRGHRRLAYFNRQQSLPGDQQTIDGISQTMGKANRITSDFTVRFLPSDDEVCKAECRRLLNLDVAPTGFICRTARMADAVRSVVEERDNRSEPSIDVVICDCYARPNEGVDFVYPRATQTAEEQGHKISQLLAEQAHGNPLKSLQEVIPVDLHIPEGNTAN